MLTLDTSGVLAALDARDPFHRAVEQALRDDGGPFIVPLGIMAEIGYMIESRLGTDVLLAFLSDVEQGAFTLDSGEADMRRIRELVQRYRDLPLGYADAVVAASAARNRGRILTIDRKHFHVIAPDIPNCTILPELHSRQSQ